MSLPVILVFNPLIALVLMVPISIGGLGVSQAAYLLLPAGRRACGAHARRVTADAGRRHRRQPTGRRVLADGETSRPHATNTITPMLRKETSLLAHQYPITVDFARSLYENGGGGHDFDHVLRVHRAGRTDRRCGRG